VDLPVAIGEETSSFVNSLAIKLSGQKPKLAGAHVADYSIQQEGQDTTLHTDKFQIRKLAVVTTGANKVFAINTETSEVVWSTYLQLPATGALKRLFLVRNTGALAPLCVLLAAASSSKTLVQSFNPLTGELAAAVQIFNVRHAVMLPDRNSDFQKSLMFISQDSHEVALFPDNEEARSALRARVKSVFWHDVDRSTNTLTGYSMRAQGDGFASEQTWQMTFPASETIDDVAARSLEDTIYSPTHITGMHEVMYKYLNPNLVAVSTVSQHVPFFKGSKAGTTGSLSNPSVHLYCIDTITGHVLYHVAHPSTMGPTNIALSENWVVHTYWNERNLRTELSVVELWEESKQDENVMELVMQGLGLGEKAASNTFVKKKHFANGRGEGRTFSAFQEASPQKEEQSFVSPVSVKTLAVSSTELGITSKDLLMGTTTNQLYAMPRKFFDARRPTKQPTAEEMEEGLMQYHPTLPMMPTSVLSYNRTIAGLRGIRAVPAGGLESTSLVLAYGIDMFFCRSAPSKTFDMLPEDFQYAVLLMTIVGLSVATVAISMLSKRKDVNMLWR